MKLVCAQYDLLAPDMEELPDSEEVLKERQAQVRKLHADLQRLAKKWR
ncbi:MAG: hypothetical protein IRZ16_22115 [Myxococcaceae bacterium]|nr:hypothetical protein [Myxococcaceae bacterium]